MISIAVIKHSDKKQLQGGKGVFQFTLPGNSLSLMGISSVLQGRNHGGGAITDGSVIFPYSVQDHLLWRVPPE